MSFLKSSKKEGKYESVIINKLEPYFISQGFQVIPHARFNIAWGNILSDIDILLVKDGKVGVIEVKSSHDNLKKAKKQISKIKDFVDFVYIATDYRPRKIPVKTAGWILVQDEITIMRLPKVIESLPSYRSVNSLPKKCLERYMLEKKMSFKRMSKYQLTNSIFSISEKNLRKEVQAIATCGQECDVDCPIWEFEKLLIPKLISH